MVTKAKLVELLQVLSDFDVSDFACEDFQVRFNQEDQAEVVSAPIIREIPVPPKEPVRSMWHDKALWPDGKPPEFQVFKKDKK